MLTTYILQAHAKLEEVKSELQKEKKLREQNEKYTHELESEVETLKRNQIGRKPAALSTLDESKEIARY